MPQEPDLLTLKENLNAAHQLDKPKVGKKRKKKQETKKQKTSILLETISNLLLSDDKDRDSSVRSVLFCVFLSFPDKLKNFLRPVPMTFFISVSTSALYLAGSILLTR